MNLLLEVLTIKTEWETSSKWSSAKSFAFRWSDWFSSRKQRHFCYLDVFKNLISTPQNTVPKLWQCPKPYFFPLFATFSIHLSICILKTPQQAAGALGIWAGGLQPDFLSQAVCGFLQVGEKEGQAHNFYQISKESWTTFFYVYLKMPAIIPQFNTAVLIIQNPP